MSHQLLSVAPAPKAYFCTTATVGLGQNQTASFSAFSFSYVATTVALSAS
jgi:hypothetical protein